MKINPTIAYYDRTAERYSQDTRSADVSDLRRRFERYLHAGDLILDFGCGSGRDSRAFLEDGYQVDACDGSAEMCRVAGENTGLCVRQMMFQDLDAEMKYDGIWACASVLHLSKEELIPVLGQMRAALKMNGCIYASFKYGDFAGERNGRYFTDLTEAGLQELMKGTPGLFVAETWISADVRKGRAEEKWLNAILRRDEQAGTLR